MDALQENRKIIQLSLISGIGGFLFALDAGFFPGISMSILQLSERKWMLNAILISSNVAAIIGAALAGLLSRKYGLRPMIMAADGMIFWGALTAMWIPSIFTVLLSRILVGCGFGMASVSCNVYVAEIVPSSIRGKLLSGYGVAMTWGFLCSNFLSMGYIKLPEWHWMLGVASVPAAVQFILMCPLPESPRWFLLQGMSMHALESLCFFFPPTEAEAILDKMRVSFDETESPGRSSNLFSNIKMAFQNSDFCQALFLSVGLQTLQKLGLHAISYFGQLDAETSEDALMNSVLSVIASIGGMCTIDKMGRRVALMSSLIVAALIFHTLSLVSWTDMMYTPGVQVGSNNFAADMCPSFSSLPQTSKTCFSCLKNGCGFCQSPMNQFDGACLVNDNKTSILCGDQGSVWHWKTCPSRFGLEIKVLKQMFTIVRSLGLDMIPAIINAEIFPVKYLGLGAGLGSMAGWIMSTIGVHVFSTIQDKDSWVVYLIHAGFSWITFLFVCVFLPETAMKPLEEM